MTSSNQDIPKKIQELQSAQSQIRFWRTLSIVAIILIVVTCVGLISTAVGQLASSGPRQQEFLDELVEGVNQDVVPQLQQIASSAAADVAPMVQEELEKLNARAPEFAESLRQELYNLSVNVSGRSEKILRDNLANMVERRRIWMERNFNDVTKEKVETMAENLTEVASDRAHHFVEQEFAGHIVALNRITENLQHIQKTELENVRHDVPTWEMALLFFDIVRDELRGMETLNAGTELLTEEDLDQVEPELEASEDK
jgi:hypothetical protein